jgi:sugar phosphate isomerase/epimerase
MIRRTFLRHVTQALIACGLRVDTTTKLGAIGIQAYTVRSLMQRDVAGTLAALAAIGYREVELAGFYGKTAAEMRRALDSAHLIAPSGHVAVLTSDWDTLIADAKTIGQRYIVCPFIDAKDRTVDGYKRIAKQFNAFGERTQRAGIQFAYHNHDFEFENVGGIVPYDLLCAECDPKLVQMEIDIFWMVKGGRDPVTYFAKYPGRFPMVHAKDMTKSGEMVDVGKGFIDFAAIFRHSAEAGLKHVFVEHDEPPAPLDDARTSYEYLRQLTY